MARILIVDDTPNLRTTLRLMLEEAGHTVGEAADGEAGVAAMKRDAADLAIVDVFMPGRGGVLTIDTLRKTYPKLRIIAISGGSGDLTRPEDYLGLTRRVGADHAMAKPIAMDDLLGAVDRLLRGEPAAPPAAQ